jgi:hypothetical protein
MKIFYTEHNTHERNIMSKIMEIHESHVAHAYFLLRNYM